MDALGEWIKQKIAEQDNIERFASVSDDELKRRWDMADCCGCEPEFCCECLHLEMNRRGLGEYCAV